MSVYASSGYGGASQNSARGATYVRPNGRGAVAPKGQRPARLDPSVYLHDSSNGHSTPGPSPLSPREPLTMANVFATSSFARPAYAVPAGATYAGSNSAHRSSTRGESRRGTPSSRSDRQSRSVTPVAPATRSQRRQSKSLRSATTSTVTSSRPASTSPPPPLTSAPRHADGSTGAAVPTASQPRSASLLLSRPPPREDVEAARRAAAAAAAAAGRGNVGITGRTAVLNTATTRGSSSSPLYSTVNSSGSATGPRGGGAVVTSAPVTTVPNPLRPLHIHTNAVAEASHTGLNATSSPTSPAATASAATAAAAALLLGSSQPHCSHCKAEVEALYRCPCGLARYCSTACQHAHWPVHTRVCNSTVRAAEASSRRCDWCGVPSTTLRQCGCAFAYYCDTHCQRADWPYHRLVCSTAQPSSTVVAAVLPTSAPRQTREASTQTTHWQISVPVLRSLVRQDSGGPESPGQSADTPTGVQGGQQFGGGGSMSYNDGAGSTASLFPRSNRTQPPPWDRGSQLHGDSTYTDLTSSTSRSFPMTAGGGGGGGGHALPHMDPSQRLGRTLDSFAAPSSAAARSSHTPYHFPRSASFYESLHVTAGERDAPSPMSPQSQLQRYPLRVDVETSPTLSKAAAHNHTGFGRSVTSYGPVSSPNSRQSYGGASEIETGTASSVGGAGGVVESPGNHSGALSPSSFSPLLRDQPSLLAFTATSQRKVESDERKEWAELCAQFREERVRIELRVLPRAEEAGRMAILKEEVRWCVMTGYPAAKALKQGSLRPVTRR